MKEQVGSKENLEGQGELALGGKQHLKLVEVDTDSGTTREVDVAPEVEALKAELQIERDHVEGLRRDLKGWTTRFHNLKRDKEAEARRNGVWPECVAVFRYWQLKTGHEKAKFTAPRFFLLERFVRMYGQEECRKAIDGCVASDYHMKRGRYAKRPGPVHDGLDLIFRDDPHFDRFREMAPVRETIRGASMLKTAREVAERVLERAKLIDSEDPEDLPAVGHLLIEINRLLVDWRAPEEEKT